MKRIFLALTLVFATTALHSQDQKNVVVILVDDLGWKDLGYSGSPLYLTPNIDALASESVIYSNAYSAHPVCSPSRAALLTGKNPIKIGISDWIPGSDPKDKPLLGPKDLHELPLKEITLAERLKDYGYSTFFAGKWHLGGEEHSPSQQGFDINVGGIDLGSPPGGYYVPYKNPLLPDGPEGEYLTDRLTTETIDFITAHKDSPFFAYLSYYTVHTPIQANKDFRPKYNDVSIDHKTTNEGEGQSLIFQDNLDYASMVSAMDNNVGRLVRHLKDEGLWENTILVFTSDNGGLSTLNNQYKGKIPTSTFPKRGGKGWCYEGGIRIPLLIHSPGDVDNKTCDKPVTHMDIVPTILENIDIDSKATATMEGEDILSKHWIKSTAIRPLFWHFPHYHGSAWTPGSALRRGDWKLIYFYEDERSELYNLAVDESENVNLAKRYPDKVAILKKELFAMIDASNGKYPSKNHSAKK
ncbi:sulfatase [Membranihabitans marinus]|uniref:sulfatase n=1 Tax=Membranihabitans marinus TaxID=1227546 RepID=UPI001F4566C1|nr:sulfatase [Membranihabitans marinus]